MRKYDENSDYMSREMDEELEQLEEEITALYANASNEIQAEFTDFMADFEERREKKYDEVVSGKIPQSDYEIWLRNQIFQKLLYKEIIKSLTNTLVNTDIVAMALVRGDLPYVIGQSYNFIQSLGWKAADEAGYSIGTFEIYNADAVQALIRENPELLPYVDLPIDEKWNKDRINNVITHSLIQGNNAEQTADALRQVAKMDETTAIRTARTAMTYAENLGRDESYKSLRESGIPVRKKWSAILDERTRPTHRLLNGTYANSEGLFGEGILDKDHLMRCPADPNGEPQEIYNCRCRLGIVFDNSIVDHSKDDELYEQFLKENYPEDYKDLLKKDYFRQHSSRARG